MEHCKLMPRLHLLQSSHDLFVYDFLYDFFGIVGGYKLRRMWLHCLRSPYDFFRRQTRTKLYRDLVDIVRQPHDNRKVIVQSSCYLHDLSINARTMTLRLSYDIRKVSVKLCFVKSQGVGTLTVQLSCNYVHRFKRLSMFIFAFHLNCVSKSCDHKSCYEEASVFS